MTMTSKEIVQKTLYYQNPERVARSFGDSDFVWVNDKVKSHATDWKKIGPDKWERTDEWGNLWGRLDSTTKGEVVQGVLSDVSQIADFELPDYSKFEDYWTVVEGNYARKRKN